LLLCLLGEVLEFEPGASRSNGRVLSAEIGSHFVHDVFVAARFELGVDDALGILFGAGCAWR
jgi:hypothetical protein